MNWLDVTIIVVILLLTFFGWRIGVIRAASTIGGVIVGVYLAGQYHEGVANTLGTVITNDNGATVAAFGLIFIGTMVVANVIGGMLRRALKLVLLGWADGVVGATLGLAIGLALVSGLTLAVCTYPVGGLGEAVGNSSVAKNLTPLVSMLLPEQFEEFVNPDTCAEGLPLPL